jgi:hypothetical protein
MGMARAAARRATRQWKSAAKEGAVRDDSRTRAAGRNRRPPATAVVLLLLATLPARAKDADDEPAAARLDAMARFLVKAPRLRVTLDTTYDVVQDTGQKIEFGETRIVTVRRPDRARVETTRRDGGHRGFLFDGTQLAVFDLDQKVYATAPKPGTLDAAFDYLIRDLNMRMPLAELFESDLPGEVKALRRSARWVGTETLAGVATDHVAVRGDTADIQLWIAHSGEPLVRRIVITYRLAEGQPQFSANFSDWSFAPEVPDTLFTFTPAEGAEKIPFFVPRPGASAGGEKPR